MAIQTKIELAQTLIHMAQSILADDSFEGGIEYSCVVNTDLGKNEFEVKGAYRTGNREGQGRMRILK
jgi:hypothetical protein